jgi:hypothetical protein
MLSSERSFLLYQDNRRYEKHSKADKSTQFITQKRALGSVVVNEPRAKQDIT